MEDGTFEELKEMVEGQEEQWGANIDRFDQSHAWWVTILTEEVGKLAQAVVRYEMNDIEQEWPRMRILALSAAGVAMSMVEALDANEQNCPLCCNYEEKVEDRECPEMCLVVAAVARRLARNKQEGEG